MKLCISQITNRALAGLRMLFLKEPHEIMYQTTKLNIALPQNIFFFKLGHMELCIRQ